MLCRGRPIGTGPAIVEARLDRDSILAPTVSFSRLARPVYIEARFCGAKPATQTFCASGASPIERLPPLVLLLLGCRGILPKLCRVAKRSKLLPPLGVPSSFGWALVIASYLAVVDIYIAQPKCCLVNVRASRTLVCWPVGIGAPS